MSQTRSACRSLSLPATLALLLAGAPVLAAPVVFQGQLDDRGQPADGYYDLQIRAYSAAQAGKAITAPIDFYRVPVHSGSFRLDLDLPVQGADKVWLELAVRDTGSTAAYSAIPGRSEAQTKSVVGLCWSTSGDSGSVPGVNFLGTLDAQPFEIRTFDVPSLRIEPSAQLSGGLPITANVIGGSLANSVSADVHGAHLAGGSVVNGDPSFLGEGPNRVTDHYGVVAGGAANIAGNDDAFPANRAFSFVGAGLGNQASGLRSSVLGGQGNTASGADSLVGSGDRNIASGNSSAVLSGLLNEATGSRSLIVSGQNNLASGTLSVVLSGNTNEASASGSTVAGGTSNVASGLQSVVLSGFGNTARGSRSMVAGGVDNCAGGDASWAGGTRAKIRPANTGSGSLGSACAGVPTTGSTGNTGVFMWADSQSVDLVSTLDNTFVVRAENGFWFGSNSSVAFPTGRFIQTTAGGAHLTSGGTWTNGSSRALKTAFENIDVGQVLDRVLALPLQRWSYRASPEEGTHLGPVAEDFHAAFGLGSTSEAISTVDADGVALAAIQGLNARLMAENAALKARVEAIEGVLATLEQRHEP